jgi:hypothetical protein
MLGSHEMKGVHLASPSMHQLAPILFDDRFRLPCSILFCISLILITFVCNAAAQVAKAGDGIRCCMGAL